MNQYNDPPIPDYVFVTGKPDQNGSTGGCNGCDFRHMREIRCSRIPCQTKPNMIAKLTTQDNK